MELKEFFSALISSSSDVSSKRIISLVAALMLFISTIVSYWGIIIQVELIYALVVCIVGTSALTLFQKPQA